MALDRAIHGLDPRIKSEDDPGFVIARLDRAIHDLDPCMDASRQWVVTRIHAVKKSAAALYPALSVVGRLFRLATGPDVLH